LVRVQVLNSSSRNVRCHASDYGDELYNVHEQQTQLRTAVLSCGQLSGRRELWAAEDSCGQLMTIVVSWEQLKQLETAGISYRGEKSLV
jgi:hypothetical protein